MKRTLSSLIFLIPIFVFSQTTKEKIQSYLISKQKELELTSQDVSDFILDGETSSESTKITNYFIKQRYQGIEIYNAISNVWIKNNEIINIGNRFESNLSQKINTTTPTITVLEALSSALNKLEIQNSENHQIIEAVDSKNFKISNGNLQEAITAELVYQLTEGNQLRLAWDLTITTPGHQHIWSVRIDAVSGKILDKHDRVISCNFRNHTITSKTIDYRIVNFNNSFFKDQASIPLDIQAGSYNVIPFNYESPNHTGRQLITSPSDLIASPFGWHDTNGAFGSEFTITRGNNVFAQEDVNGDDGTGTSPNGGTALSFNFPYAGTAGQPSTYLSASTTNLFYMCNVLHDVWYQYGFNEINGNFQQNNYGKGGTVTVSGDAVNADSQDGESLNNANFSPTDDGSPPRIQMFLWNVSPAIQPLNIITPIDIAGLRNGRDNNFNPGHVAIPIAPAFIQSDLVLYEDEFIETADACTAAINPNEINNHITVIRRGDCTFASKVKFAQLAGATAVIIVNNVAGEVAMAGADATITIPAISVSFDVGEALITRMATQTVNAKLQVQSSTFINSDGDFDNGIISHEYGHGISTRLTGGPLNSGCLNNAEQMGEGWSDWFALMLQLKAGDVGTTPKGIGTFAISQPTTGSGIRSFPYSTDMNINPKTFNDSNDNQQHSRGEFMATVLWDLTWAYIAKYGFNSNVYTGTGGNNKVMRLVIDGLKLQPCSPTVVEYRTALIAADQATTGGQDYCLITEVFRRRGVGLNASSGLRTSATDQVENFTAFAPGPNCTALGINNFENENIFKIYPNPTNGMIHIRINNFIGKTNFQVVDINGRIVYQLIDNNFNIEKTIDLSQLQSGMYILKVTADDLNFTEKIILK